MKKAQIYSLLNLYLKGENLYLDFSYDETLDLAEFYDYNGISVVSEYFTLAAKTWILHYKRLGDNETFESRKHFRHLFDIYRIYEHTKNSFDDKKYFKFSKLIVEYETKNKSENHRLIIKEKDFIKKELYKIINEPIIGGYGTHKRYLDKVIALIEQEYNLKVPIQEFKNSINWFLEIHEKILDN